MVVAAAVVLGLAASLNIAVSNLPDVRPPRLVVSTVWPGLPAAEIRETLTKPIEDVLAGVKGLKSLESVSRMGVSVITVDYHWGTDLNLAGVELRELIDSAYTVLPAGAGKPLVLPVDPADEALMVIGVFPRGGDLGAARRLAEREIRTRLQQVPGAGTVVVAGGSLDEVAVQVDRSALAARGLSLDELARILAAENYDYPAGVIHEGDRELAVKTTGTVGDLGALAALWIKDFRLGEVARLEQAPGKARSAFSLDGQPGIGLYVHRQIQSNPLAAAAGLREELERLGRSYGQELEFRLVWDSSRYMSRSLQGLGLAGATGVAAAFLVLFLFIGELRASLIIMSAIPLAILCSLAALAALGRSLNLMSIAGLTLGIGMMIDNSVVIVEHLDRRLGGARADADGVIEAASALSLSNMASTVTSIIVFLPLLFLPGLIGAVFADLALAVMFAQVASWIVSVTVVPVLYLRLPRLGRGGKQPKRQFMARAEGRWARIMAAFVRRPVRLFAVVGAMGAAAAVSLWFLPVEFMPLQDSGVLDVELAMAHGQTVARSVELLKDTEVRLKTVPGVAAVFSRTGGEADDWYFLADPRARDGLAAVRVVLSEGERRPAQAIANELRGILAAMPDQADFQATVSLPANPVAKLLGMDGGTRLVIAAESPSALEGRLAETAAWFRQQRRGLAWTVEPEGMRTELRFTPDRPALARYQAGLDQVAQTLRDGTDGALVSRLATAGHPVPVRLSYQPNGTAEDLGRFPLRAGPQLVELRSLGEFREESVPEAFYRHGRHDAALIVSSSPVGDGAPAWLADPQAAEAADQLRWLLMAIALILVLLYLFLGAQLQSFTLPALLMSSIPLAFGGIFAALLIARSSINLDSLLGVIVLMGVVINSAMVLFETYETLRELPALPRVFRGTRQRIRPILITSSITVVSLLPMALNFGGANSQSSLTVAVIGGLVASTVLSLFVVPALFLRRFRGRHA
jgi:multidrug efflux pump subunit AcrB